MKKMVITSAICSIFLPVAAFAQDTQQIAGELMQVAAGGSGEGLIGGFSPAGLIATVIFSGVGFIAFVYGKKNTELKPLLIGIALMVYPYFIRQTLALMIVGLLLCTALYFWRD